MLISNSKMSSLWIKGAWSEVVWAALVNGPSMANNYVKITGSPVLLAAHLRAFRNQSPPSIHIGIGQNQGGSQLRLGRPTYFVECPKSGGVPGRFDQHTSKTVDGASSKTRSRIRSCFGGDLRYYLPFLASCSWLAERFQAKWKST